MSDENAGDAKEPTTAIRPGARADRMQAEQRGPAGQPEPTLRLDINDDHSTPRHQAPHQPGPQHSAPHHPQQQWGPPQGQQPQSPSRFAPPQESAQPGPAQHEAPQQPVHQPAQQWGPPQQPPAQQPYPAPPGKRRKDGSARAGRSGGAGIGLLAGALILGAGAGFGGGYLHDETSGGGGDGDKVDAGQIDIGGLNLQDLVSVQTVAEKTLPSVVKIEALGASSGSTGSGIILSDDGLILTNYHVAFNGIDGDLTIFFDDGSSTTGSFVGADPDLDIALIKADDSSGLTPMKFGAAEDLKVGQAVVAVGSPYGLESTVTAGIISTVNRPVNVGPVAPGQKVMAYPALQTDAAINPGNSGGALVNIKGELVGMNSANRTAVRDTGDAGDLGSIGIGWAIPINVISPIVEQLKNGDDPTHAWLGIVPGNARESGVAQGAQVADFTSDSPAEAAGLETGDVVVAIDDYPIAEGLGLITTALLYRPGDKVTLRVLRDGEEQTMDVTLAEKTQLFDDL
ncbi:S1C family serine protease [Nocardioides jensenii]|uniref:S1C family serine protease n=1 Tax=Nocardioides jensenii TaxID=1843 RepID=UPI00083638CD|nr:trypsin-like peptidase domain-containing protein [Nocardioides jensenii]